jgi:tetratricopeptide (TPR) repeat protein
MNFEHWRHYARGWLWLFFKREKQAYDEFRSAHTLDQTHRQTLLHLASIDANQKRYGAAEGWFEKALAITPDDSATWFNLAYVRESSGSPATAIPAFMESVRCSPNQDVAWYGLGMAHARLGQHTDAVAAFEKVAELQPMFGDGLYQLGMAYHHNNAPEKVKQVVVRLVGFEPKRAKQLVRDAERSDLMSLIPDLPF